MRECMFNHISDSDKPEHHGKKADLAPVSDFSRCRITGRLRSLAYKSTPDSRWWYHWIAMDFALLTLAAAFQAVKASYDPTDPRYLAFLTIPEPLLSQKLSRRVLELRLLPLTLTTSNPSSPGDACKHQLLAFLMIPEPLSPVPQTLSSDSSLSQYNLQPSRNPSFEDLPLLVIIKTTLAH